MLLQILGQFVFDILGEAVLRLLSPDWPAAQSPPEEGEWNASLGSVAAFLAALGATFGGLASYLIMRGRTAFLLWAFLAIGGALALAAEALARRTFEVTRRRHTLARMGMWLSRSTFAAVVLANASFIFGLTFRR